jgi:hypothetical protein
MRKIILMTLIICNPIISEAITSRFSFSVRSCGVSLISQVQKQNGRFQEQVIQNFNRNSCDEANRDCEMRRQEQIRQSKLERGGTAQNISFQCINDGLLSSGTDSHYPSSPINHYDSNNRNSCRYPQFDIETLDDVLLTQLEDYADYDSEGGIELREWNCNCPPPSVCGDNPSRIGGGISLYMNYRKCLRNLIRCLKGEE